MVRGLLNPWADRVRDATLRLMQRLIQAPPGHLWALSTLEAAMPIADVAPRHCDAFYTLLCEVVYALAEMPHEVCPPQSFWMS